MCPCTGRFLFVIHIRLYDFIYKVLAYSILKAHGKAGNALNQESMYDPHLVCFVVPDFPEAARLVTDILNYISSSRERILSLFKGGEGEEWAINI
jgi:hypothetical protein